VLSKQRTLEAGAASQNAFALVAPENSMRREFPAWTKRGSMAMLLYRAVSNAGRALPSVLESSMAKCFVNEMVRDVAGKSM